MIPCETSIIDEQDVISMPEWNSLQCLKSEHNELERKPNVQKTFFSAKNTVKERGREQDLTDKEEKKKIAKENAFVKHMLFSHWGSAEG